MADSDPAEVFGLLADRTRVDILVAMARARKEQGSEAVGGGVSGLSFSDIYEQVEVDNTSKLSYHLGELVGTFLQKTENGYTFTHAGDQIVRTIVSGNYEQPPDIEPTAVSGECPFCGASQLETGLGHSVFTVTCLNCERPVFGYFVTPAQVQSHDPGELVASVAATMAGAYSQVRQGVCPWCTGQLTTTVSDDEELDLPESISFLVRDECEHCLRQYNAPLPYRAAYHPASIGFHWDHGVDIMGLEMWKMHNYRLNGQWTSERADGPATYRVVLRQETEALHLFLDADATVTRTERVRGRTLD